MSKQPFIKFDNHISLGHIFTTLIMLIGGVSWVVSTEGRLYNLEKHDTIINKRIDDTRSDIRGDLADIKIDLREISNKLDKKADK